MITSSTHITAVVDEPCQPPSFGSINDVIMVYSEEVAAPYACSLVLPLPLVCHALSYHLPHILYHHLVSRDRLQSKQAPVVDS